MHIEVIKTDAQFEKIEVAWNAVYAADPEAEIYMSWRWMKDWLRVNRTAWFVLAAKVESNDSGYVGFFPVRNRVKFAAGVAFYNELSPAGAQYLDYTSILVRPEHESSVIETFMSYLRDNIAWGQLKIDNLLVSPHRRKMMLSPFGGGKFKRD